MSTLTICSGLGFATCCRLIDEFLLTRPQSQSLHLLFSTRDARKGEDTLKRLNLHLQKSLKDANRKTPGISLLLESRIKLEGVLVDLTRLLTVKRLATQLLDRNQPLDAIVWNAGVAGWKSIDYPRAIWDLCTKMLEATTYPDFMIPDMGLLAPRQLPNNTSTSSEPRLGQVFTANIFGHYMLTHWLSPLMTSSTRIIWTSSISGTPATYHPEDLQGLAAQKPYESSKRLTDLLVLTSTLPSTRQHLDTFLPTPSKPQMFITHPGVIATAITGSHWLMLLLHILALYISRWLGSPWHPVTAYKGAVSTVFAILAPASQLSDMETVDGKGKWGSACDVFGGERVVRTEIEGWGFGGEMGTMPSGSLKATHRKRVETTRKTREEFEEAGERAWREMEALRTEWERRLDGVGVGVDGGGGIEAVDG